MGVGPHGDRADRLDVKHPRAVTARRAVLSPYTSFNRSGNGDGAYVVHQHLVDSLQLDDRRLAGACTGEDQMTTQPGGRSDTKLGESGNIALREGIPDVGIS